MQNNANREIVFPELSYAIIGAAFRVYNELGWGMTEKEYQKAPANELTALGISFQREVYIPLEYRSTNIGRYFADFIIEKKILLELKVVSRLGYTHVKQVLRYVRRSNLRLGILLYFTKEGIKYRRILNSHYLN